LIYNTFIPDFSGIASGLLCRSFGVSSRVLRELPKSARRIPEGFPKNLYRNYGSIQNEYGRNPEEFLKKMTFCHKSNTLEE